MGAKKKAGAVLLDVNSPAAQERWAAIAIEARRRRLAVEIRDGTTSHPYGAAGKERSGAEWDGGNFDTLDQAFRAADTWVRDHPLPGPVALRDELRDHGRKLAVLTPRALNRAGGDFPLYRHFRDRILPLAFDNLTDAVRMEALEDAIRALLAKMDTGDAPVIDLEIATLRGLVGPKEEDGAGAGDPA